MVKWLNFKNYYLQEKILHREDRAKPASIKSNVELILPMEDWHGKSWSDHVKKVLPTRFIIDGRKRTAYPHITLLEDISGKTETLDYIETALDTFPPIDPEISITIKDLSYWDFGRRISVHYNIHPNPTLIELRKTLLNYLTNECGLAHCFTEPPREVFNPHITLCNHVEAYTLKQISAMGQPVEPPIIKRSNLIRFNAKWPEQYRFTMA